MARDGSGTAIKAVDDFEVNTTISEEDMNDLIDDIIDMLTQSVSKDGQTTMTGSMRMGGQKIYLDSDETAYISCENNDSFSLVVEGSTYLNASDDGVSIPAGKDFVVRKAGGYEINLYGAISGEDFYINSPDTGTVAHIVASGLNGGSALRITSSSTSTNSRSVLDVIATSSSATGESCASFSQGSTAPAIEITKTTLDGGFFNFIASADSDTTSAISTNTTSGATTHHIQVEINGTKAWIAASTNNPS